MWYIICDIWEFSMSIRIEGSEAKFDVNILGNITKQSYIGTFKVKCLLSPLEDIEADKLYRDLLGNNFHLADKAVKDKALALAQLKVRVLEAPPFWENEYIGGGHISDSNVILDVIDLAIQAQEEYVKQKEEEMKQRQELLTKAIKNKQIEKDPEVDSIEEAEEKLDQGFEVDEEESEE